MLQILKGDPYPNVVLNWIAQMETKFKTLNFPNDIKVQVAIPFLVGDAKNWWSSVEPMMDAKEDAITWEFRDVFLDLCFPRALRKKRQDDFYNLKQIGKMSVLQHANKFAGLGCFYPKAFGDEEEKMDCFEQGLRDEIECQLSSHKFTNGIGENLAWSLPWVRLGPLMLWF